MAEITHPFYESHHSAMQAAKRHRLDLAEAMLSERARLSNLDGIRQEVMAEFDIILTQMPHISLSPARMTALNSASTTQPAAFANSRHTMAGSMSKMGLPICGCWPSN
jgi:hypothetical protein